MTGPAASVNASAVVEATTASLPSMTKSRYTVDLAFEVEAAVTLNGLGDVADKTDAVVAAIGRALDLPGQAIKLMKVGPVDPLAAMRRSFSANDTAWVLTYAVRNLVDGRAADALSGRALRIASDATLASAVAETTNAPGVTVASHGTPTTTARVVIVFEVAETREGSAVQGIAAAQAITEAITGGGLLEAIQERSPDTKVRLADVGTPAVVQVIAPSPPPPPPSLLPPLPPPLEPILMSLPPEALPTTTRPYPPSAAGSVDTLMLLGPLFAALAVIAMVVAFVRRMRRGGRTAAAAAADEFKSPSTSGKEFFSHTSVLPERELEDAPGDAAPPIDESDREEVESDEEVDIGADAPPWQAPFPTKRATSFLPPLRPAASGGRRASV